MVGWRNWIGRWVGVGLTMLCADAVAAPPPTASQASDARQFDDQFRPLLVRHCVACHSGDRPKGNLRLDNLGLDLTDAANREHQAAAKSAADAKKSHDAALATQKALAAAKAALAQLTAPPAAGVKPETVKVAVELKK